MFGRTVKIGDLEIFVTCTPRTPMSVILQRASQQMSDLERDANDRSHALQIAYKYGVTGNLR